MDSAEEQTNNGLAGKCFFLVTLGCFRNEVESDVLRTELVRLGLVETGSHEQCDVVLVNTCGFIRDACEEGIDTILELDSLLSELEARPPIIVVGCMGERYGAGLLSAMPEVSCVLGAGWAGSLGEVIAGALSGRRFAPESGSVSAAIRATARSVDSSEGGTLLVRVADGCDRACAFCTIPAIRGRYSSRPVDEILAEIRLLAGGRDREVVLLAQDLTSYGKDRPDGSSLPMLVEAVASLDRVRWLRLLYLQPEGVTPELVDAVAGNPRVCDYFDIPFQHAGDRVLKRMGRPGNAGVYMDLIESIRIACPDAALRTTLMVGYPGETDDDFAGLMEFVDRARFDWMGAFCYSREEGTKAADLGGAVPQAVAVERYGKILELQDSIEAARAAEFVGRRLEVLVDGASETPGYDLVGRSYREAPVVDGVVYLKIPGGVSPKASPGIFIDATITGQEGLDLVGEVRSAGEHG
jgi:ribosomal protein S12 methylthiotransferase